MPKGLLRPLLPSLALTQLSLPLGTGPVQMKRSPLRVSWEAGMGSGSPGPVLFDRPPSPCSARLTRLQGQAEPWSQEAATRLRSCRSGNRRQVQLLARQGCSHLPGRCGLARRASSAGPGLWTEAQRERAHLSTPFLGSGRRRSWRDSDLGSCAGHYLVFTTWVRPRPRNASLRSARQKCHLTVGFSSQGAT